MCMTEEKQVNILVWLNKAGIHTSKTEEKQVYNCMTEENVLYVMISSVFVTFPYGWLYRFLIFAFFHTYIVGKTR